MIADKLASLMGSHFERIEGGETSDNIYIACQILSEEAVITSITFANGETVDLSDLTLMFGWTFSCPVSSITVAEGTVLGMIR